MFNRRLTVALVAAITAASAGTAANTTGPPLLTYAAGPIDVGGGAGVFLGLCATDLQGMTFRLSDPRTDVGASWSPDGRSIAFLGPADPPAQDHFGDLLVTDAQGRNTRNLTQNGGRGSIRQVFGWSPDGSELGANWSGYFTSVFIGKADGTGGRLLAEVSYGYFVAGDSWSPDGRQILLSRSSFANPVPTISVIDADGTNERELIAGADRAAWSPDGRQIAYISFGANGRASGVGVAQADGGNAHPVLQGVSLLGKPAWSPDGDQLAYIASSDGIHGTLGVMRADGSNARVLTSGVLGTPQWSPDGSTPQWSPDGSLIAFTGGPKGAPRVAVVKPDGSGEQDVAAGFDPVWRVPATLPSHRRPCIVHGTSRADAIHGTGRGDVILAGRGADRVDGAGGPDVLVGGLGPDRLLGGSSADVFGARDRTRDHIVGGSGSDTAYVDPVDVRSQLETVH